ncbi:MAG TPA: bifunctional acetate--CoA ligase family protein/GNAT family N-acetyltransferase [Candidatus Nanoarchaeia archaeon]|nr:bifunctional acetate--CoA ligase family protein/GNAT family N-acetyltransferase [Candidatus Nanoarchaeia archaeon]
METAYPLSEKKLDKIFNPGTIAVIGASDREGGVGNALMKNLIGNNFGGIVYPVNLNRDSVQGIKAYPRIGDIPDKIDLAIIATPAPTVPAIVEECGQAGVSGIIIISSGFDEIGAKGHKMSEEILATAREYNMRVIGPNCLGFIRPSIHLNASFANKMALPGHIAFISQSGALCTAILDWSLKNNVGFSQFVSIGSNIDISFHDLIDYFGDDPNTDSILIYMESLTEARKFMSAARAFSRQKPIVVLKVGRTEAGSVAAKSHTGAITGNDAVYDAAFERAGIIRVDGALDLFHVAKMLAMQQRPADNRVAVITNAGGPGAIAADWLAIKGGRLAQLSRSTVTELKKFLPAAASTANPVDILGDADPHRYRQAVELCLADPNVDAALVILTPQEMTSPTDVARQIVSIKNKTGKTMFASWMGGDDVAEGREILEKGHIPIYRTPEEAVDIFMYVDSYRRRLEFLKETPGSVPHAFKPKTEKNRELVEKVIASGRVVMTEAEAKEMIANYGIPVAKNGTAKSAAEAGALAEKIGMPVVMKILSPDILHKTDIGGVKLNINSKSEAEKAFVEIMNGVKNFATGARRSGINTPRPSGTPLDRGDYAPKIDGIFIEAMTKKRYELLIGCKKDEIFGPAIVFGMGGVAVEVFRDTAVGLPPLNMSLALKMIQETKIYRLLEGYRGMPGVDIEAIQFLLYKFAYLVSDFPEIKELDINPFAVDENGGVVLDAKIILDEKVLGVRHAPYSHLVISPYPKDFETTIMVKSPKGKSTKVFVRPLRPEDEELVAGFFRHLTPASQKDRYLQVIKKIDHEFLLRFTQNDYDREIGLEAEIDTGKKPQMVGAVRLICDPYNENAKLSVVLIDSWQGKGLGSQLVDHMLSIAKSRGIKKVWAEFFPTNKRIIKILEKRNFTIKPHGKTMIGELELG